MQKKHRGDLILMILLAILCLLPTGIFEGAATPVSDGTTLVSLDHPFKLKVNETAYFDSADLLFRFVNVTEDSRCPADVQCIWAGQVSVEIEVVRVSTGEGLGNFALTLIGGSENSQKATIGEYVIKLVSVEPYPISTQTIHLFDYVATLIISSSENVDSPHSPDQSVISLGKEGGENGSPSSIAINHKTNLVYVSNRNSDNVVVINATTNKVVDRVSVGFSPGDLAVNSNTNTVYVTRPGFGNVSVIDGETSKVVKAIEIGPANNISLDGIAVDEKKNKIYVLVNHNYSEDTRSAFASISVIDGLTNTVNDHSIYVAELKPDYDVMDNARGITVNPTTNKIYVVLFFGNLYVIDGYRAIVSDKISIGYEKAPHQVNVNDKTNTIYVSNFGNQSVSIIDGSTNDIFKTIQVGFDPQGIAVDNTSNRIYVVTYGNDIAIIDGFANEVVSKVKVGEFPERAAFNHNNGLLYVSNTGSNSISIIDTSSYSNQSEWKTGYTIGKFLYSEPPKPDQIFKVYYRVIDGSIDKISRELIDVSSNDHGMLQIKFPRNYPYTNEYAVNTPEANPILFVDGILNEEITSTALTDCFFVFSIPFSGNRSIGLAWEYLLWTEPHHGDNVPNSCLSETLVENVTVRRDGTISPLQQVRAGLEPRDVVCPYENQMLLISMKDAPYCADEDIITKLRVLWQSKGAECLEAVKYARWECRFL